MPLGPFPCVVASCRTTHPRLQHYLRPEEFVPYFKRAIAAAKDSGGADPEDEAEQRIRLFYDTMADLKLLKK